MVRLKESKLLFKCIVNKLFQFLDGAIKRSGDAENVYEDEEFQFLDGAIKRKEEGMSFVKLI